MRRITVLILILFLLNIKIYGDDSTYTHLNGYSEFLFNKQTVSGNVSDYSYQPYFNRNNRNNISIDAGLGNNLYFYGNVITDGMPGNEKLYKFSLKHTIGKITMGQFNPKIPAFSNNALLKGVIIESGYSNHSTKSYYFYNNMDVKETRIKGNDTEGPFSLGYINIKESSEKVMFIDQQNRRMELERTKDYTINYISGEIRLKSKILKINEDLIVCFQIESIDRYSIFDGSYNFDNDVVNFGVSGGKESIQGDTIKENSNVGVKGGYKNSFVNIGSRYNISLSDSLFPSDLSGNIDFNKNGFYLNAKGIKIDDNHTLLSSNGYNSYHLYSGFDNDRLKIAAGYNISNKDSIKTKNISAELGYNIKENFLSYNFERIIKDNYSINKHYIKDILNNELLISNISSGFGDEKRDTIISKIYFIDGSVKLIKYVNAEVQTENKIENYNEVYAYHYNHYIKIANRWRMIGLNVGSGLMNDNDGNIIFYGKGGINGNINQLLDMKINFQSRRENGTIDTILVPVNRLQANSILKLNLFKYINIIYKPQVRFGIYNSDLFQEYYIKNGGEINYRNEYVSTNLSYFKTYDRYCELNNLEEIKRNNKGQDIGAVVGLKLIENLSLTYNFKDNRKDGLYNIIIPTQSDTSGDTLLLVKTENRIRHSLDFKYLRDRSNLDIKIGYENRSEMHQDTLYKNYKMTDFEGYMGREIIDGLSLSAGIYVNGKYGYDIEIAQDSGWSYSVGPLAKGIYSGKYGNVYVDYRYIQSYGSARAKINEFKLGGKLKVNVFGIGLDCFIRNGVIPSYNVKRISGKVGVYF